MKKSKIDSSARMRNIKINAVNTGIKTSGVSLNLENAEINARDGVVSEGTKKERWHETWWGRVILGVIIFIITSIISIKLLN